MSHIIWIIFLSYNFSADKNKPLLAKGCISPFHLTPELKEHLFNLGGEWKFIPDKKGLNRGIKFADPIVLTPENTECKFFHFVHDSWTMGRFIKPWYVSDDIFQGQKRQTTKQRQLGLSKRVPGPWWVARNGDRKNATKSNHQRLSWCKQRELCNFLVERLWYDYIIKMSVSP